MKTPYQEYKNTSNWKAIKKSLKELEANNDLEITTNIDLVVGYLCSKLAKKEASKMLIEVAGFAINGKSKLTRKQAAHRSIPSRQGEHP